MFVWDNVSCEVKPVDGLAEEIGDPLAPGWKVTEIIDFPNHRIIMEESDRGHKAVWYIER